jgi:hypothetical protein
MVSGEGTTPKVADQICIVVTGEARTSGEPTAHGRQRKHHKSGMITIDRRGSSRLVFCIHPWWTIKVARNPTGLRCNWYEADLYQRTTPARRAMLCPVRMLLPGSVALVMQRAEPLSDDEARHLIHTDGFPDWDYMPPDDGGCPFEYKGCDWGRLPDGRLVALDYSTPVLN